MLTFVLRLNRLESSHWNQVGTEDAVGVFERHSVYYKRALSPTGSHLNWPCEENRLTGAHFDRPRSFRWGRGGGGGCERH